MLNGLSQINIELTSRCNKSCPFCGHQDTEVNHGLVYGDIQMGLLESIRDQLPPGVIVQFHRDGEPTLFPALQEAIELFPAFITSIVTNGKLLAKKADQIINRCTSLTVSAFNGDEDQQEQIEVLKEFLSIKGDAAPMVNIKIVGTMPMEKEAVYARLGVPIIHRLIHIPDGNYRYARRNPTVPEHGLCLDFLSHPSIDWRGNFSICNRLDTTGAGVLGNLNESTLDELWNGETRRQWLAAHKRGRRDQASPLCHNCLFYGVPSEA